MRRTAYMTRGRRLRSLSAKRSALQPMWRARRGEIFERDGWGCQAAEVGSQHAIPCWGPLDPHHTIKRSQEPSAWLDADLCLTLCRRHHEWTDGVLGAQAGKLLTVALGGGRFRLTVTHETKWERRHASVGQ